MNPADPQTSSLQEPGSPDGGAGGSGSLWKLLGSLPVPIMVHELGNGATRFVNPSFTMNFGYTLTDMPTLEALADRIHPEADGRGAVAQWRACVLAQQQTGAIAPAIALNLLDKSNRSHDVLMSFALHSDFVVITFQDRTQTVAAERRQHELAAYALTENMPAGAYTMVLHPGAELAEFAFVSKQFLHMLELTREEAVGDPSTGFSRVHPEDRPHWLKINAEAFAKREPFSGEARIVANGEIRWIRAESVPRELDNGSVIWEGILVDITRLKETEARLKAVLLASRAFTWNLDLRTERVWNDELWTDPQQFNSSRSDRTLASWLDEIYPEDKSGLNAALQALRQGLQDSQALTYRRRNRSGHWLWMQVHAGVSQRDADGTPTIVSGVSFDITAQMTARLRAAEEQAQLREDLQRAQQRDTVAQVAGRVAHDLNNLNAVVAGTTEMLELQAVGKVWLQEGLGRIRRSVAMARDLIAGLGGLVRPPLPRKEQDLGKLMEDAMGLLGQRRIARHEVRLDLPEACPSVWANPTEMAQVIVNLAINACDSGSPDRPATVTLAALPAGTTLPPRTPDAGVLPPAGAAMALFTIHDTGAGISDEIRGRMFRPDFTTKSEAGTGLGLLIVSTILQSNRGAMWVDSSPGRGSCMTVAWPTEAPASADADLGKDAEPRDVADTVVPEDLLRDLRVLVVDDLADVADVLADMLDSAGAVAVAVSDPQAAAQVLAEAPEVWSVLVTDLHMNGMDGRALARHAAALSPPIPTVLITARRDMLTDEPAAGFAAVLSKPVTAARLARAVREAAGIQHQSAISG